MKELRNLFDTISNLILYNYAIVNVIKIFMMKYDRSQQYIYFYTPNRIGRQLPKNRKSLSFKSLQNGNQPI